MLLDEGRAESLAYKQSWKFVILTECIRAYAENYKSRGVKVPKQLAVAERVLERLFDSPIPSIGRLVGDKILSISSLKLPKGGASVEDGEFEGISLDGGSVAFEDVKENRSLRRQLSENIGTLLSVLEKSIESCIDELPRIFICFDKVDEAWDEVSFEDSKLVIAGLVSASDSISSGFNKKVRPLIFLREDIFDVLSINDANKLREDCGALLHWNRSSLSSMLLHRINYFAKINGLEPVSDIDALFDRKELRQRNKPLNHIIKRTMMRPRDLISFLSKVLQRMKEEAEDPFRDEPIVFDQLSANAVYDAEPGYSEWLEKELIEEWAVQRPVIKELFNALRNNASTNFTKEEFARELEKLGVESDSTTVDGCLRFLFDNSIIGFKIGQSAEWKFKCFYPSQGFVSSSEYRVHEGLVRALNLTESRDRVASAGE